MSSGMVLQVELLVSRETFRVSDDDVCTAGGAAGTTACYGG